MKISPPDPARLCLRWGWSTHAFDLDLSESQHSAEARERVSIPATLRQEMKTDAPAQPCSRCAAPFKPTSTRRLLCKRCFTSAE